MLGVGIQWLAWPTWLMMMEEIEVFGVVEVKVEVEVEVEAEAEEVEVAEVEVVKVFGAEMKFRIMVGKEDEIYADCFVMLGYEMVWHMRMCI